MSRESDPEEWAPKPENDYFSPALAKIFASLHEGPLRKLMLLADKIERGDADETDRELERVYDGFVELADYVRDLAHMVRRREEAAAEQAVL